MPIYPLKFTPILKERIWGGNKLHSILRKPVAESNNPIGESWEISGIQGELSVIANGNLKGKSIQEMINIYESDFLGHKVWGRFKDTFPILVKFIDAKKDLSIQVHPNDKVAYEKHQCFGKTEMWYIVDSNYDSELVIGFNINTNKVEYKDLLEKNKLKEILNYEGIKENEAFFINPGKVHAIGANILLAEIQQTSDITYRIYDYDRKDPQGKKRELHTDLALDVIDYKKKDDYRLSYNKEKNKANNIVTSPYFITNYLSLDKNYFADIQSRDSFTVFMCLNGNAQITTEYGSTAISFGQTVLVPAKTTNVYIETKNTTLLEVYI